MKQKEQVKRIITDLIIRDIAVRDVKDYKQYQARKPYRALQNVCYRTFCRMYMRAEKKFNARMARDFGITY